MSVASPPEAVDVDGLRWVRTDISKGADLINGRAWVDNFRERAVAFAAAAAAGGAVGGRRRVLRQVASTGDDPQYWATPGELPNPDRNRILEQMSQEGCSPPGRRVMLPSGDDVIFWFNVGPTANVAPAAERVFVTSARCPHQGVCLEQGELREIEDLAGRMRPVIRCPRHNRLFDVSTGEGLGPDSLRRYQARFFPELGRFYVALGPVPAQEPVPIPLQPQCAAAQAAPPQAEACCEDMDVDPLVEPEAKRSKADLPTPLRTLAAHRTLM